MALGCDLRIASTTASFGAPEVRWAILHGFGAMRLPRTVPMSVAMEMLLTGERIDAARAYEVGLVSRIVEPAALLPTAPSRSPSASARTGRWPSRSPRSSPGGALHQHPDEALRYYAAVTALIHETEDAKEGPRAFSEKRSPRSRAVSRRSVRHPLEPFANPRSVGGDGGVHRPPQGRGPALAEHGRGRLPRTALSDPPERRRGPRAQGLSLAARGLPRPVDLAVVLVRPGSRPRRRRRMRGAGRARGRGHHRRASARRAPRARRLERELAARCARPGARMIGPNCAGLFSASGRVNVLGWRVPAGPIAVISQSGNMALTFAQLAREKGLGFSKLITVGNAADVRIPEYVDYLFADPETQRHRRRISRASQPMRGPGPLSTSCGAIRRGQAPHRAQARRDGERAPGGAVPHGVAGRRAPAWWRPHCAQCGRHPGGGERGGMGRRDGAGALLPPLERGSVVVISDGGGHATIVCDAADQGGLARARRCPDATRDRLGELLPARSGIVNPVDFAGVAEEEPEVVPRVLDAAWRIPTSAARSSPGTSAAISRSRPKSSAAARCWRRRELARWSTARRQADDRAHDLRRRAPARARGAPAPPAIPVYRSLGGRGAGHGRDCGGTARPAAPRRAAEPGPRADATRVARLLVTGAATGACSSSPTPGSCSRPVWHSRPTLPAGR